MAAKTIKLSVVLRELDVKLNTGGNPKTFAIKFVKKNGELMYYHRIYPWRSDNNFPNKFVFSQLKHVLENVDHCQRNN